MTKKQSVLDKITTVFARHEIYQQYSVLDYKFDTWFPKHKIGKRNEKETTRENRIKQKLQCEFIRIIPDKEGFDIFLELANIENHIADSIKKTNNIFTKKLAKIIFRLKNLLKINKVDIEDVQLNKEINELDSL